jgi:uncharacterized membrane protein YbhN (UPF0104 family)
MLKGLRAAAHFFNEKVGFSRLGVALSLTIIIVAAVVLYHILRDIDLDELVDAIEATDWRTLVIAGLFVAAGYLTLTFYDLFALRTIGRYEVPYRAAALGSFTSYAVGHNVGASVFSGGAVRYRIYSAWGLSVVEVTKICFVAGLTFWLGNAAMLGLGVLYSPQQASDIDQQMRLVGHQHVHGKRAERQIEDADHDLNQRERPAGQGHLPTFAADDARFHPNPRNVSRQQDQN